MTALSIHISNVIINRKLCKGALLMGGKKAMIGLVVGLMLILTISLIVGDTEKVDTNITYEDNPTISKNEYTQVKNGMSYTDVKNIVGGEGEVFAEMSVNDTEMFSVKYIGDNDEGSASVSFTNGKVTLKTESGLK